MGRGRAIWAAAVFLSGSSVQAVTPGPAVVVDAASERQGKRAEPEEAGSPGTASSEGEDTAAVVKPVPESPAAGPDLVLPPKVSAESLGLTVEARVDRAVATTGDVLLYEIVVERPPSTTLVFPDVGGRIVGFRIVDLGREEAEVAGGKREDAADVYIRERRWYKLRADITGSYVLPPVVIGVRGSAADPLTTVQTSAIFVEVESVLPEDGSATDIRPIKPLVRSDQPWPWKWTAGGLGAAALVLLAGIWLVRRKRPEQQVTAASAHEIAFAALNSLRQTDFNDPLAVRRYTFALSTVMRNYLEERFKLNATDLTSEELLRELGGPTGGQASRLSADLHGRLRTFLEQTDQVKFADHAPSAKETAEVYEAALSFVEATMPAEDRVAAALASSTPAPPGESNADLV